MVVASIDLSEFDCAVCAKAAERGGDQKAGFSGKPGSCEGPREYRFFSSHPSGGFVWTGCPRTALTDRGVTLIRAHDRCEGKLSLTEQQRATGILLDAFDVIDYAQGVRSWQEAKDRASDWKRERRSHG